MRAMFLLVRLLRPYIHRASGRTLVVGGAAVAAAAIVLLVVGIGMHHRLETRIGILLVIAGGLAARIAFRSRRARGSI